MDLDTFQQQALIVHMPDDNFDPTIVPENGEQYLTQVVYERKNCPAIVVASKPSTKRLSSVQQRNSVIDDVTKTEMILGGIEIVDTSPLCLRSTSQWREAQLKDFNLLQQKIIKLRAMTNESNNLSGMITTNEDDNTMTIPEITDHDKWKEFCQNNQPLLSVILRIDQKSLEKLLEYEAIWLRTECNKTNDGDDVDDGNCTDEDDVNNTTDDIDLTKKQLWLGLWIYSTLACLHLPIEPDCHSLLRDIAKICIKLRNKMTQNDSDKVIPLNLFILIISKVFSQLDLFDYV